MRMKKDKKRLAKTNKEQARLHLQEVCEPQRLGNSVDDINSRRISVGEVKKLLDWYRANGVEINGKKTWSISGSKKELLEKLILCYNKYSTT